MPDGSAHNLPIGSLQAAAEEPHIIECRVIPPILGWFHLGLEPTDGPRVALITPGAKSAPDRIYFALLHSPI